MRLAPLRAPTSRPSGGTGKRAAISARQTFFPPARWPDVQAQSSRGPEQAEASRRRAKLMRGCARPALHDNRQRPTSSSPMALGADDDHDEWPGRRRPKPRAALSFSICPIVPSGRRERRAKFLPAVAAAGQDQEPQQQTSGGALAKWQLCPLAAAAALVTCSIIRASSGLTRRPLDDGAVCPPACQVGARRNVAPAGMVGQTWRHNCAPPPSEGR